MKRTALAIFCVLGFLLIAAPIYMNQPVYPVLINGKPFARAVIIDGVLAISVEDLAKAVGGGGTLTLEQAGFKLQGNTLSTLLLPSSGATAKIKHVESAVAPNAVGTQAHSSGGGGGAGKVAVHDISIKKQVDVSSAVLRKDGKPFVPLVDVVKAFGGTLNVNQGNLKPGDSISLNFAVNGDGALAVAPH